VLLTGNGLRQLKNKELYKAVSCDTITASFPRVPPWLEWGLPIRVDAHGVVGLYIALENLNSTKSLTSIASVSMVKCKQVKSVHTKLHIWVRAKKMEWEVALSIYFFSRPNFHVARMFSVCTRMLATCACYTSYLTIKHYAPCFKLFTDKAQQRLPTARRNKAMNTFCFSSWISNDLHQ